MLFASPNAVIGCYENLASTIRSYIGLYEHSHRFGRCIDYGEFWLTDTPKPNSLIGETIAPPVTVKVAQTRISGRTILVRILMVIH